MVVTQLVLCIAFAPAAAAAYFSPQLSATHQSRRRHQQVQPCMLEPPLPLPYEVPKMPKPFADYEWDDDWPGTFKPGKRPEQYTTEKVLEMWEGRDNPACFEIPVDQAWHVPLAPAEDILSWLSRIGLLEDDESTEQREQDGSPRGDSLLEDEFDLDDESAAVTIPDAQAEAGGVTLSDSFEL